MRLLLIDTMVNVSIFSGNIFFYYKETKKYAFQMMVNNFVGNYYHRDFSMKHGEHYFKRLICQFLHLIWKNYHRILIYWLLCQLICQNLSDCFNFVCPTRHGWNGSGVQPIRVLLVQTLQINNFLDIYAIRQVHLSHDATGCHGEEDKSRLWTSGRWLTGFCQSLHGTLFF